MLTDVTSTAGDEDTFASDMEVQSQSFANVLNARDLVYT